MEIKVLKSFVAAATFKNFSAAARELNMAQPAISRHIFELEEEIGASLFVRNTRAVKITPAGNSLLEEAVKILANDRDVKERVLRASRGETGILRIGYLASATASFLPKLVQSYSARNPNVHISLHVMSSKEITDALVGERIDLAFSRTLPKAMWGDFVSEEIYVDKLMAVLPDTHSLAKTKRLELEQLEQEPFILYSRNIMANQFDQVINACKKAGFSPYVSNEPSQMQEILTEVASGLGVSVLSGCVRRLFTEGCAFIPIKGQKPSVPLALHHHEDTSPTVKDFVKITRSAKADIKKHITQ